jgi:hypothetical protein
MLSGLLFGFVFAAPWLVAIAWFVHRHGVELLLPKDELPASFGELARRRAAVR